MTLARKFWSVALFGAFLCAFAAFGDLLICPKCGYESPEGSELCVHCKAKLPGSTAGKELEKESDYSPLPSRKLEYLDPETVENEIRAGREHLKKGDIEVARLFFRNAAALDMLTDPQIENTRSGRILQYITKSDTRAGTVRRKCPACGGTGKSTMKTTSLKGEVAYREVYGKACPRCAGTGYVLRSGTIDERKYRMGRAVSRYKTLQQARKFVPVATAWIPWGIEDKLSARQIVLLKRAVASPCAECMGIGRVDCGKCNGTGEVKCANRECVNGMVVVEAGGMLVKTRMKRTEKCKVCKGRGVVACSECKGNGSILCKKCNGTGERPVCRKCSGQGLITCRRCSGSGVYKKAVCPICAGQAVVICSSCNGNGRKR